MAEKPIFLIGPFPQPVNGCSFANLILARGLEAQGLKFETIDTAAKKISSAQGQNFNLSKALYFLKSYKRVFELARAKIVYMTPGQTFFGLLKYAPFILICKIAGVPYVLHLHGNYLLTQFNALSGLKRWVFSNLVRGAAGGIVLSESLRSNFIPFIDGSRIFVVPNFVSDELFQVSVADKKKSDILRPIFFSNLMESKGILEFLESLVILKGRGIAFSATVAGTFDSEIFEKVNHAFSRLGNDVNYLGAVSGLMKANALVEANIFVLPTYYEMEGQPISLLEGMAMGNIVVTTDHAGIPDVVNEENGYFVEKKSALSLAGALEKISVNLANEVLNFSSHNSNYARREFTEKKFVEGVMNVFRFVKQ